MNINIYFMGTGDTYRRYNAEPYSSKFKNIGIKKNSWSHNYYFNGPGIFNALGWTTEKAYDAATKTLPDDIQGMLRSNPENEIHICVQGHSRGSTVSVKFYKYLTKQFGSNKKITLTLKNSDSYYGPTAKKENALTRLEKQNTNNNSNSSNKTMAVYAVQTLFRCTPQQIVGVDIVIIANVGHNMSSQSLSNFSNKPEENGLYLCEKQNDYYYKYTKITKENIKDYFDFIYKYGKVTQTNRWRLFTSILMQKLGIKSYDKLESISGAAKSTSILFPNVKKEFDAALSSIRKSANLTSAFKIANKLFESGGIFSGMGGTNFHLHLSNAKGYVCGAKNNSHDQAIDELNLIINKSGRPETSIKSQTAQALIDRIKKWYKLQ